MHTLKVLSMRASDHFLNSWSSISASSIRFSVPAEQKWITKNDVGEEVSLHASLYLVFVTSASFSCHDHFPPLFRHLLELESRLRKWRQWRVSLHASIYLVFVTAAFATVSIISPTLRYLLEFESRLRKWRQWRVSLHEERLSFTFFKWSSNLFFGACTCICPRVLANDHFLNTWRNVSTCSVRLSVWCRKEMNHESGVHEEVSTCFLSSFFLEVSSARSKTRWRSVVQNLFSFISCLSFLKMVFPFPNCFPCSLQVQKHAKTLLHPRHFRSLNVQSLKNFAGEL